MPLQLDSGHRIGDFRVYEIHYVPPGHAAMRLARIYVTGDLPCHVIDRARGVWRPFEARTEYWYVDHDTLMAMATTEQGGKLVFQIAYESCPSGTAFDALAGDEAATVVEQVTPRDVVWEPGGEPDAWPADACSFALSPETPPFVSGRDGCLVALSLSVAQAAGADGQPMYALSSAAWYQNAGTGPLFAGWGGGEGVVLEQSDIKPGGSMQYAVCAFEPAPGSVVAT
jgi:hypothetical protein